MKIIMIALLLMLNCSCSSLYEFQYPNEVKQMFVEFKPEMNLFEMEKIIKKHFPDSTDWMGLGGFRSTYCILDLTPDYSLEFVMGLRGDFSSSNYYVTKSSLKITRN